MPLEHTTTSPAAIGRQNAIHVQRLFHREKKTLLLKKFTDGQMYVQENIDIFILILPHMLLYSF